MKRWTYALMAVVCLAAVGNERAAAVEPFNYGFLPFGFYQPYGAQYGTSLRTPPYFAVNPPVYYGARYARPYGMSPFASPPLVTAPSSYEGRLRSQFEDGPHTTPAPSCNPYICQSSAAAPKVVPGEVRANPFVTQELHVAQH